MYSPSGIFRSNEGRSSSSISQADIQNYFGELLKDLEGACYGQYFLEFADYYTRENMDGTDCLRLVYQSLRALSAPSLPRVLVRYVYELKIMVLSGECPQTFEQFESWNLNSSTLYALRYVTGSSIERLYTFTLTDEVTCRIHKGSDMASGALCGTYVQISGNTCNLPVECV